MAFLAQIHHVLPMEVATCLRGHLLIHRECSSFLNNLSTAYRALTRKRFREKMTNVIANI